MSQEPAAPGPAVDILLGMAAWGYGHLVGALYPPDVPAKERLRRYACVYPFVEVDQMRYAWPSDAPLATWRDQTPPDFAFVPKMHRSLTHGEGAAFGDAADWWAALEPLRERVSCVLLQFPASFRNNEGALGQVLDLMAPIPVPCVVEMRHRSWATAWPDLLAAGAVPCWTVLDGMPLPGHADPETGYVRLLGDRSIPPDRLGALRRDRHDEMEGLGRRVSTQPWRSCRVVATNHYEGSAPLSLERLAHAWGLDPPDRPAAGRGSGQSKLF